jgi:hypothetical protein
VAALLFLALAAARAARDTSLLDPLASLFAEDAMYEQPNETPSFELTMATLQPFT